MHDLGSRRAGPVLNHATVESGITDEQVFDILLLYLEQGAPTAAEMIRRLGAGRYNLRASARKG